MDLNRGYEGSRAHGAYDENDRCPVCFVPPGAPHLGSCDYDGVWDGEIDDGMPPPPAGRGWVG